MKRSILAGVAVVALAAAIAPSHATETITYTYDALGRLVTSSSSGSVNNGQSTSISYDDADNRTTYVVSGVALPSLSIVAGPAVTEGSTLNFTVTLSPAASSTVTVNYATSNGTAVSPGDYSAQSGTLTYTLGQSSKTIAVTTVDDATVESTETLTMTLSSPSGATLGTASATGTINDNDTSTATLSIGNASVTEGGTLNFTVTRTGNTSSAVSASYATAGGTATSGSDFTAKSGTVSFSSGITSQIVTVSTIDDAAIESAETMTVTLSSPSSGAAIGTATGTGTINDNDTIATSTFSVDESVLGAENGSNYFAITRTGSTSSVATVDYATSSGTATSDIDFIAKSGTLTFGIGVTERAVIVYHIDDAIDEPTETFYLNLSNPTGGATISVSTGVGHIADDD